MGVGFRHWLIRCRLAKLAVTNQYERSYARLMEEHQVLTRLVPIERKIIITNVVKYLLAGKANGDYFNEEMLGV